MKRYETSIGATGLQFYECEHGRCVQHSDAEADIAAAVAAERSKFRWLEASEVTKPEGLE